jgi:histidine triad (HIT) family protein
MDDCIFCRIASGQIASAVVLEDADFVAFPDLHPKAPQHILVVPREHVASLNELVERDDQMGFALLKFIVRVAERAGIKDAGYRVITNVGSEGGQEIDHLHFHVLGGEYLGDLR